jgi:hypothetical protein
LPESLSPDELKAELCDDSEFIEFVLGALPLGTEPLRASTILMITPAF